MTSTQLVRVRVIGERSAADIALPSAMPIRDLIGGIKRILDTGEEEEFTEKSAGEQSDAAQLFPEYSLRPAVGTPFSRDATLDAVGVREGWDLVLCTLPEGPTAPPIVEDIADAAAIHTDPKSSWSEGHWFPLVAAVTFVVSVLFLTGFSAWSWFALLRGWSLLALAGCAVAFAAAALGLARRLAGADSQKAEPADVFSSVTQLADLLGVLTVIPLGLTLAAAPQALAITLGASPHVGALQVFAACVGVATWSLLTVTMTTRKAAIHTTIVVTAAGLALAAAARSFVHLPFMTLGCGLVAISLLLSSRAALSAARRANFPLPSVPAPGNEIPPPPSLQLLEDLPRRVRLANSFLSGFSGAAALLLVVGAVLVLWVPDGQWLAWWLVVATSTITVLRVRDWDSAVSCAWFVAAPLLTSASLASVYVLTGHVPAGWWAALVFAVLAIAVIAGAVLGRTGDQAESPEGGRIPLRRRLDFLEGFLIATLIPAILWLVGVVSLILNR